MSRCTKTCPQPPLPPSFPLEAAASHPRYRYFLEAGARCALEDGHEAPHESEGGLLRWYDPKLLLVGGEVVE